MAMSAALKARLHQLYLEGAVPYADLVAESGLNRFEFQDLARDETWGKRPAKAKTLKAKGTPKAIRTTGAGGTLVTEAAPKPADLTKQVLGAVRIELNKLKVQDGTTSQDRERGSRALMQLMNTLEKAVKMHKKVSKKRGGNTQHKETLKDAEAMRREIAERLERLNKQRLAQK